MRVRTTVPDALAGGAIEDDQAVDRDQPEAHHQRTVDLQREQHARGSGESAAGARAVGKLLVDHVWLAAGGGALCGGAAAGGTVRGGAGFNLPSSPRRYASRTLRAMGAAALAPAAAVLHDHGERDAR